MVVNPVAKHLVDDFFKNINLALIYRLKHGGGQKQAIAKAVKIKSKTNLKIIDTTCGFGTDSLILASLHQNNQIFAIEQNKTVFRLLQQRINHIANHPILSFIAKKIIFFNGNANILIPSIIKQYNFMPDVIYLDPMFIIKNNKAQANKYIQLLNTILPAIDNTDTDLLLTNSLKYAKHKVVVKRHKSSHYLANKKPDYSLMGQANRFDVYVRF